MVCTETIQKPHAVCIPFPAQSHINSMLNLAKLLHHQGFHVTFVNSEYKHNRLLRSHGLSSLDVLPSFRFQTIPDGLPPSDGNTTQDIPALCQSTQKSCSPHFQGLLERLIEESATSGSPPVSCVVSDGMMSFTVDAAQALCLPVVLFWMTSAGGFMGYVQYRRLIDKGFVPLRDARDSTNGYLHPFIDRMSRLAEEHIDIIDSIPWMNIIPWRDLLSFFRNTNPDDLMTDFFLRETERAKRASAILFNTFDQLEHEVLDALRDMFPPIYTLGPLHLLTEQLLDDDIKSIGSKPSMEDQASLEWLNLKSPGSVVYVNFGSISLMSTVQLVEFAWGLANSGQTFLWVIRKDLVVGSTAILPPEFLDKTRERSLLPSWCPQERVLSHPAVGGFLTQSGWKSTIESIAAGVPVVCWPFSAEQQTNCKYSCEEWGIGSEIDDDVKREEVERQVRKLMKGEKGKEMKRKAMEWKKKAQQATCPSGSSFLNLREVINKVLSPLRRD